MRSLNRQLRHFSDRFEDLEDIDELPFSNYIMSISLFKRFKPPTNMEPYDRSMDPQKHIDAFKSRMTPAGASDPIKCGPSQSH